MILTVKEASAQWCCQARHAAVEQVDRKIMVPCIGDGCMAWRWKVKERRARAAHMGIWGWFEDEPYCDPLPRSKWLGYCGLAGEP